MERIKPVHPGEALLLWMQECGTTAETLLEAAGGLRPDVHAVIHEVSPITPQVASFLAEFYGGSPGFWMNVQARYDKEVARDAGEVHNDGL